MKGVTTGNRKVFLTKYISVTDDKEVNDVINSDHLVKFFDQPGVLGVFVMSGDTELTVGDVRMFERMFRGIFKEYVSVIY